MVPAVFVIDDFLRNAEEVRRQALGLSYAVGGRYPGLATHDDALIAHVIEFARANAIGPDRFEFQMLYGVRRDLQQALVEQGWTVRVYVPYGTQWYPYLMRRLAERPANIAFILGSLVKESVPGG